VDRHHCIKWFCHDSPLLVLSTADLYDMRIMHTSVCDVKWQVGLS
jgi:hypothetical protein